MTDPMRSRGGVDDGPENRSIAQDNLCQVPLAMLDALRTERDAALARAEAAEQSLLHVRAQWSALEIENYRALARNRALEEGLRAWEECALYDATMEGPRFKGWNRSALDRLRLSAEARALLAPASPETTDGKDAT